MKAKQVAVVEKKLKHKLPATYRQFLLTYEGDAIGAPENPVASFFGFPPPAPPSLSSKVLNAGSTLPEGMIPIADAPGGKWLLLETGTGKVFSWEWEREEAVSVAGHFDHDLKSGGAKVTESDLKKFEKKWVALPARYRSFLLRCNGGTTEEGTTYFCVEASGGPDDLNKQIETYRKRIPSDTLPIARDWGGNLFLLGMKGKNAGKVFRWSHEEEADEGERPTYRNVRLVADDFDQFVRSLDDGPDWEAPAKGKA